MTHAQVLTSRLLAAIASAGLVALGCGGSTSDDGSKTGPQNQTGSGGQTGQGGATSETGGGGGAPPLPTNVECDFGTPELACYGRAQLENMVRTGGGQIPVSPVPSDAEVAAAFLPNGCLPASKTFDGCCNPAEAEAEKDGEQCCYVHCTGVCCGRPLFVEGVLRVAPFAVRLDWAARGGDYPPVGTPPGKLAAEIARAWREDALFEHASVASFARFSLDLLALAAPPDLVLASHRAALDEIEHARLCFGLAERFGGAAVGPGPLDLGGVVPAASLADAVVSAIREGCVGETVAALVAREQLARAVDPAVRAALLRIAEDEASHAELAFRFVAWALRQDRGLERTVRRSFDAELERNTLVGPKVPAENQAAWSEAGRLTGAELTRIESQAKRDVVRAALQALLSPESPLRDDRVTPHSTA